jgi:hypothetical protein
VRRAAGQAQAAWQHGALQYDPATKVVRWKGVRVDLTGRELALLEALLGQSQRVLSKAHLLRKALRLERRRARKQCAGGARPPPARKIDPGIVRTVRGRRLRPRLRGERRVSLQRRLLLYLLVCAPLVWGIALYFSINRARHEVNELYDTELIRLARQVQSTLGGCLRGTAGAAAAAPAGGSADAGESDVRDLAVAVWDSTGQLVLVRSRRRANCEPSERSGFFDEQVAGKAWRVYYLQSLDGRWLVAAGQGAYERDELVSRLTVSHVVPWLIVLPFLWPSWRGPFDARSRRCGADGGARRHRKAEDLRPMPDDAPLSS